MPVSSFRADCPPCIEPGRLFVHLPWRLLFTSLDNNLFETSSDIRGNCRSCPRPQDILWSQEVSTYQLRNVLVAFLLRNLAFIRLGATSGWDHILNVSLRMPRSRGGFKRDPCREAGHLVTFAASVPPADQGDSHRGGRKSVWG